MKLEGQFSCTGGRFESFEDLKGQKFILYAYPKDNTSGCTLEAMAFAEYYERFKALGYEVIGLSKDTLGTHKNFIKKHNLPFELISDVDRVWLEKFELVVHKKMYGKDVKGTERSTFVFDEALNCVLTLRNVDPKTHVEDLYQQLKALVQ